MPGVMAGGRALSGVAAGAGSGAGVPGLLGLLLVMEAGVPVPVPGDLVMLLLGDPVRPAAGPRRARTPAVTARRSARPEPRPGAPCQVGRRYTSRLASLGVLDWFCPDLLGQSRPLCPGDCWTCSTAGEPPFESGVLPELLNALVANSTTASPASTVATRMARQGRHPVRAAVTGSSGK